MIAGDLLYFFDANSKHREEINTYLNLGKERGTSCREHVASLEENVIKAVGIHIEYFPIIKKIVKKRNNKRIDLMSYKRSVESSKKTGSKYHKKVLKMQKAESVFNKINDDLIDMFQDYMNYREQMLDHYIHYVIDVQMKFCVPSEKKMECLKSTIATLKGVVAKAPDTFRTKVEAMKKNVQELEDRLEAESSSLSPSSTADMKEKCSTASSTAADNQQLRIYNNPPFDTSDSFERRHRLYAPSSKVYEATLIKNYEIAMYPYAARNHDELSFKAGDMIQVLEIKEGGWWMGVIENKMAGLFPCNYTQPHVL
eukprot:CAMPEP_0185259286 /NCGR_PEP_ID=MMETSP1359-20130426/8086_1 /TAXON_ID=552665 /ORGANISM="Bigelowiella longifila, Strain CCMP242" /LENGTH=311 /DNA_ID=CAMNT_0027845135 /DNA_START=112 /DNA_END=1047 /DNA_ORIENTATION=+